MRYQFFTSLQGALPVFHIVTGFSTRYRFLMYLIGKFVTDVFTSLPVSQSVTRPVTGFTNSIGRAVPRVKILLVHLTKNPNSRADVDATWHSFLVTVSSLLVTIITFGHYIRLLLYVPSRPGTNAI